MADTVNVDDDTLAAVGNLWRDTPALRSLYPFPQAGRLKAQAPPYVHAECKLDRRECAGTGTGGGIPWHDYRTVTLTVVGVKARVTEIVEAINGTFHQRATLVFPSAARFMQWWPVDPGTLVEDPDRKEGQDQWRGVVVGRVWSVRVSGS